MSVFINDILTYESGKFSKRNVEILKEGVFDRSRMTDAFEFNNCFLIPSFVDVHVHLREPGFSFKETILTGTKAAARGGYTVVCAMPNLKPVPDCMESLQVELDSIRKDAVIKVLPYASVTVEEKGEKLSNFHEMADKVIAFSDDGKGVQSDELMREAMLKAKSLGKMIVAHCEDNSLVNGGYIHKGVYAEKNGHAGISSESEWRQIERDLKLIEEIGCRYHVCHVSAKESVELIREAKQTGLPVTCETAPHYLVLCDEDLQEDGRFKMNPPIRGREDREALIEGITDGTIDVIATDHAPHTKEEKAKGLKNSVMGITGLECAFPVLYTSLVKKNLISFEKLIELMCIAPRRIFNISTSSDYTVVDLNEKFVIDSSEFESMGKATPFDGMEVFGKVKMTVMDGEIVFKEV